MIIILVRISQDTRYAVKVHSVAKCVVKNHTMVVLPSLNSIINVNIHCNDRIDIAVRNLTQPLFSTL